MSLFSFAVCHTDQPRCNTGGHKTRVWIVRGQLGAWLLWGAEILLRCVQHPSHPSTCQELPPGTGQVKQPPTPQPSLHPTHLQKLLIIGPLAPCPYLTDEETALAIKQKTSVIRQREQPCIIGSLRLEFIACLFRATGNTDKLFLMLLLLRPDLRNGGRKT